MRLFFEVLFRIACAILMLLFWRIALELLINGNFFFIFVMFWALIFTLKTFE